MESYEKYVGTVLDNRYKIEKIIGVGGMAIVFKAYDMLMNITVAIKMLKEEINRDEESVIRFINESKAVSMMNHRNIVRIYDVSINKDVKYISMEYVEGITLRSYMSKRQKLSLKEIISYSEQILSALAHAHAKGVVHRDIKPQNIMLLRNGVIKVTDFGIAKLPNAETVTMTDKAIGTVYYISPEQASGLKIDRRSDLYSLGIMMYEMATGELPFNADRPVSVAMMQINEKAKKISEVDPDVPKGLEQIIEVAMEKEPEYRYQSAEEMLRQIHKLKENPNIVFKVRKHIDPDDPKSIWAMIKNGGPMFPIISGVALAFIIVFIISGIYIFNKVSEASKNVGETITIEEFVGSYLTNDLEEWFKSSDVYKLKINYIYSEEYEANMIVEQDPLPNSTRKVVPNEQYCEITLTVCSGVQEKEVPDLSYVDYREAQQMLKSNGFACAIEYKPSSGHFTGQVISSSPEAGEKYKLGETVTIYVCKGYEEGDVEVPNFVGKTEKEAFKLLLEKELLPGKITYIKSDKTKGTIVSQTVNPKSKVANNSKIGFTISGGKNYDPKNPDGTTAEETTKKDVVTTATVVTTAKPKPDETTVKETEETTVKEVEQTTVETAVDTTEETNSETTIG